MIKQGDLIHKFGGKKIIERSQIDKLLIDSIMKVTLRKTERNKVAYI
jgi:hypothetical protein